MGNQGASLGEQIAQIGTLIVERTVQHAPSVLGAVLLLLAGWVVASILRALTGRVLALLDRLLARVVGPRWSERVRMSRSAGILGTLVFWAVVLFFATAASSVLGLQTFTQWLARVLDYLPALLAGLMVIVVGLVLARITGDLIRDAGGPLAPEQRRLAARAAQVSIVVAAVLVAADQIGVRVTFLAIFVGIAAGTIAGGIVLAVSLGARTHVANLIGAQRLRRDYLPGQRIRVAGFEGRILELTEQSVVIETSDGRVSLPGRIFSEEPVVLLAQGDGRG
jgi:hypothetical protein